MVFGRKHDKSTASASEQDLTADDLVAIEQYERLVQNASPDDLLQVHADAFEKLTPEQRDFIYNQFLQRAADDEHPADAQPRSLAETATRIEQRKPGTLRRLFEDPAAAPLWNEPNHSIWLAFAGYIIASELSTSILLDADAAAAPPYDPDAVAGPDPNFDGGGGGYDGGYGGGYDGGGGFGGGFDGGGGF
jgi:hypothetical protein